MIFDPSPGLVLDALSGVLLIGLGAFVVFAAKGRTAALLFGAFSIAFGLSLATLNVAYMLPAPDRTVLFGAGLLGAYLGALALLLLLARFPRRLDWLEAAFFGSAAVLVALVALRWITHLIAVGANRSSSLLVAMEVSLLLVVVRLARRHADDRDWIQAALVSAALMPWPALSLGIELQRVAARGNPITPLLFLIVVFGVTAVSWLVLAAHRRPAVGRYGRIVALSLLAGPLVGFLVAMWFERLGLDAYFGPPGVARTLSVLVLGYAMLRHQFLGLDVKVRWTISKATVAAVFVTVFFVAGEAAQQFFGDLFQKEYLGIAAAGFLVFAIAPLSRWADRIATTAVPMPAALADDERSRLYRSQLRLAWRDGSLGQSERAMLERLRRDLGLSLEAAHHIENEALQDGEREGP